MCNKIHDSLLAFSKLIIFVFSLVQLGLISIIVLVSKRFEDEKLYNIEDLGFKSYRD